jgi:hypothetical protein
MLLPPLLWLTVALRPLDPATRWEILPSISAYYHTGAVVAFTGILSALAVFLFTYRGYANGQGRRDRFAATIAATAAVIVAAFPSHVPTPIAAPTWWTEGIGEIHYIAAATLFGAFIFFCLVQFPISNTVGEPLARDKQIRNFVYRGCGILMIVFVAWAGISGYRQKSIFWPEALALECFALSWLVKGRAGHTASYVAERVVELVRKPMRRA